MIAIRTQYPLYLGIRFHSSASAHLVRLEHLPCLPFEYTISAGIHSPSVFVLVSHGPGMYISCIEIAYYTHHLRGYNMVFALVSHALSSLTLSSHSFGSIESILYMD